MKSTDLTAQLFNAIQARTSRSVFLGVRKEGSRLSFGLNATNQMEFWIELQWPDGQWVANSGSDCDDFTLILNQSKQGGPLQFAIFESKGEANPILLYDGADEDCPPVQGEILILATAPNGRDHAVLSVAFDGEGRGSYLSGGTLEAGQHLKLLYDLHHGKNITTERKVLEDYEPYGAELFAPFQ